MDVSPVTRRRFLKSALPAAAGLPWFHISGTKASGRILGANDRLTVGICGLRNRGSEHLKSFLDQENIAVTTLIDVDESLFGPAQRQLRERTGREASRIFDDIRWALEDANPDILSIATCNHTHALYAILACQAGKDVYVETPMSHHLEEGPKVAAAAAHYRRIVQHGAQWRSSPRHSAEIAAIRSGRYGKLQTVKVFDTQPFRFLPPTQAMKPPPNLNWDAWIGPAPLRRFQWSLLRHNWRHYWDFGNGTIGDGGLRKLDVARRAVAAPGLPAKVWALGGSYGLQTPPESPNVFLAGFDFGETSIVFESRNHLGEMVSDPGESAVEFHTTAGAIRNGLFFPSGANNGEPLQLPVEDERQATRGAFSRFLSSVRNRDPSTCPAPPEDAHQTCALCHLANIAFRLAQPASFLSGRPFQISDNPQAGESFDAITADLTRRGFPLAATTYHLSPVLTVDPKTERFAGDHSGRANLLISRKYRDPWEIPEIQ